MYEKFTTRARRVLILAQEEARAFNHNFIGAEHLLLGLLREDVGIAAQVLKGLGLTVEDVRLRVKEIVGEGAAPVNPQEPLSFTSPGAKVLEAANQESLRRGHDRVGTEHLLYGLLHDGDSVACRILVALGATLDQVRRNTDALVQQYYPAG
ncbi:hypothetical protein GCM10010116_25000 [Microbispora rosea subsp. aerata]|nr:Clp protease N-terminal domain-containing protein [Microbispora rosea]GGO12448.1 hypothetical protein GCM10010116_25000 [Microbispora rosea subsp. aerata]GIH54062.1 hypothetical protein Mro02_09760 [Microbispora rosea subsp. aerata]GLJ85035.1 hypothetical protein GCM10017588_37630 [Microbispora rosea subsp. aerata]